MNSLTLWHSLLQEPITHPLLMRTDPHIPRPTHAIFNAWSIYVYVGTLVFITAIPFISVEDGILLRVVSILILTASIPVGIFYFIGVMLSPYTVLVGIFQGFNASLRVSNRLEKLYRTQQIDMIAVTAPGRDLMHRAIAASVIRARDEGYITSVYQQVSSHFLMALALMAAAGTVIASSAPPTPLYTSPELSDKLLLAAYRFVPAFIIMTAGTAVLHMDFRQLLTLGVTSGIFGTVRFRDLFGAQTAAAVTFFTVLLTGSLTIALISVGLSAIFDGIRFFAVLVGYAGAIIVRESMIVWMWREIDLSEV